MVCAHENWLVLGQKHSQSQQAEDQSDEKNQ